MATRQVEQFRRHLRQLALGHDAQNASDAELLERFVAERDELAFETLLGRHARMVMGVCRRLAGDVHVAEDAFQATFLVLVRKAGSIQPRERVGNWLYGVAYRTALQARSANARRRRKERPIENVPQQVMETPKVDSETMQILHEELHQLPDKYRAPILLCDVQGRTRLEASRILRLPDGTLSNRLSKARALMAKRLMRRGIALGSGGLTTVLLPNAAEANVAAHLLATTSELASQFIGQQTPTVSAQVWFLSEKTIKTVFHAKLRRTAVSLALAALLIAGFWFAHPEWAGSSPRASPPQSPARARGIGNHVQAKRSKPGKIYAYLMPGGAAGLVNMAPDGTKVKHFPTPAQEEKFFGFQTHSARLAPNNRHLAFGVSVRKGNGVHSPEKIYLRDITKAKGHQLLVDMTGSRLSNWFWSPDGKKLVFTAWDKNRRSLMVDVKTKKVKPLKLPPFKTIKGKSVQMSLQAWSPDGKWFLAHADGHLLLAITDGSAIRRLTAERRPILSGSCRFSPDGRKLLFVTVHKNSSMTLWVTDIASAKTKAVAQGNNFTAMRACWSPDSRRIAYSVMFLDDKGGYTGESNLNVIDADGRNSTTIHRANHDPGIITIHLTDWR